jgi:nucleotide-binding universal stress UspA family protein
MNTPKYVIVVGIDYSTASERALDEALALACAKHGAQLHIANVRSALDGELREYVARQVAVFQATAGVAPFQHLFTHQRMNDPAHELAQLAADVDADLLVVGTHDWRGEPRPMLGSVAEAVTRLAPCPVLVVRRKAVPAPARTAVSPE